MLCGDDGRFFNHSENPNCDESVKDLTTAIKNIEIGEELTVDYRVFYGDINDHSEII
jgi:SET domain-containing protein